MREAARRPAAGSWYRRAVDAAEARLVEGSDRGAGVRHSCAALVDNSLWCWGDERDGAVRTEAPRRVASPARRGDPAPADAGVSTPWQPVDPDESFERTIDARLRRELGAGVTRDCYTLAWKRGRCDARGDLDGDGQVDRVVTIRRTAGKRVRRGLAVLWGGGGATMIGAGRAVPGLRLVGRGRDDQAEPFREAERDLRWIAAWDVFTGEGPLRVERKLQVWRRGVVPRPAGAVGDVLVLTDYSALLVLYVRAEGWAMQEIALPRW